MMALPCRPLTFAVVVTIAFLLDFVVLRSGDDTPASCWLEFKAQKGSDFSGGCVAPDAVTEAARRLLDPLDVIVRHPYFRYVRVNLEKDCPYWAVSLLCTSEEAPCSVWRSSDSSDVPPQLQCEDDMCDLALQDQVCYSQEPPAIRSGFFVRSRDPLAHFVDLQRNVEANTGYVGPPARRIWEAIYNENCLFEVNFEACSQQLVFFRLISGLHASISTHLSVKYALAKSQQPSEYEPNCTEYFRRVGLHPNRLRNMHFLFRFLLQAAARAAQGVDLSAAEFSSGVQSDDLSLRSAFHIFGQGVRDGYFGLGESAFNTDLFRQYVVENGIGDQVRRALLNITSLMNCLECEKCRLWGKVQTVGLAAALELNIAEDEGAAAVPRADLVALFNVLRQVTEAHRLAKMCPQPEEESVSEL
jgi:ERO1-like protein alpha